MFTALIPNLFPRVYVYYNPYRNFVMNTFISHPFILQSHVKLMSVKRTGVPPED